MMKRVTRAVVREGVRIAALRHAKDPPQEWARSCKWDGVARIANFLDDIFQCGLDDYTVAVSRNLFIGLAARILQPGCKNDTMIVLESEKQGIGKSSVCGALVPSQWFGVINRSPDDPKFIVELQGKLVLEVAELSAFSRADKRKIKSMLTVQSDFALLPYGHYAIDLPRRCVFVGTTNRTDYLDDDTGNRRFLPIRCSPDLPTVAEMVRRTISMRDQLIGEAVAAVDSGATWHDIDETLAASQQNERMEPDSWMDAISEWNGALTLRMYGSDRRGAFLHEIMKEALKIDVGKQTKGEQMRTSACLRRLGWRRSRTRVNGKNSWIWMSPD
jgi:putative DNA primase/helicase